MLVHLFYLKLSNMLFGTVTVFLFKEGLILVHIPISGVLDSLLCLYTRHTDHGTASQKLRDVLRVLKHPHQLWQSNQFSSSVTILLMIVNDWKLVPTINLLASKIRSQNSSLSSLFSLKQLSLSVSYLQEYVQLGAWSTFGGVAKIFAHALRATVLAPPSLKSWEHH